MIDFTNIRYAFLGLLIVSSLAFPNVTLAQGSSSATGSASAEIVKPISLTEQTSMDFGILARSNTAGTAILTPSGALTTTGDVQKLGGHSRAVWNAVGEPNATVDIILPINGTVDLLKSGSGASMGVNDFITSGGTTGRVFSSTGHMTIVLGATLGLSANQETGVYTGTYPITVVYN